MNKIPEPIITLLNNPLTHFFLWLGFNAEWAAALSAGVGRCEWCIASSELGVKRNTHMLAKIWKIS